MSKGSSTSSKLHEKHQLILADLLRDEDNKYCADCLVKGPRWASWNLGVFMCIRCAGIHRNMGVHISRVKSVNLDSWTPEQIESIQKGGNRHAKNLYEAHLPANFRRPQDDYAVEQFIRGKYERKMYMARGDVASNKEHHTAQEQKVKSKVKKSSTTTSSSQKSSSHNEQILSVPRPSSDSRSPSPQPSKSAASSSTKTSSSVIGRDSGLSPSPHRTPTTSKRSSPQPVVDLLTGPIASSDSLPTSTSVSTSQPSDVFASTKGPPSSAAPGQGDLMFATEAPGQQATQQDPQQTAPATTKDSIMSLFNPKQQPPSSYTAQGFPVNAYYYQQQQAASMQMAQMSAMQQHQVKQVTAQMQKIKMNQGEGVGDQPFPPTLSNGIPPVQPHPSHTAGVGVGVIGGGGGGQTLNPTLW